MHFYSFSLRKKRKYAAYLELCEVELKLIYENPTCILMTTSIILCIIMQTVVLFIRKTRLVRPSKKICAFPIDPKFFYHRHQHFLCPKKIIDRQNPEIRLRFRLQQLTLDCCDIDAF